LITGKKMYYSISEVCELTGLEQHVLRYWEAEIPQLRPKKNSAGKRAYREKDIELIRRIKHLLYDEKLSIQAARQHLAEERKAVKQDTPQMQAQERQAKILPEEPAQPDLLSNIPEDRPAASIHHELLADIREGLEEVLALLTSAGK